MLKRYIIKTSQHKLRKQHVHKSACIWNQNNKEKSRLTKIRNIGILAHVDAGKTTTTERMLFYSGLIRNMGEVHHGNTITDYMTQERERGITITSAAVSFDWKKYRINLIDTPGHIDFTMQVEQTLRVLDGAVVILDGSAGVEPQTLTVCKQADKYNIPNIIYINKMDKPNADFKMSLASVESKLQVNTLVTQLPIREGNTLEGIVDIITLEKLIFDKENEGATFTRTKLSEVKDTKLWETANEARRLLTEKLSDLDDKLAEIIIEQESLENIPAQLLVDSLRRVTLNKTGTPILLGSSYRNIGVQPLLDSIILYLPTPENNQSARQYQCFNDKLSARIFKIIHDKQRGPISFIRVYTGTLKKGDKIYNIQKAKSDQCQYLYAAFADEYEIIPEVSEGNIAGIAGLKTSSAGDIITSNAATANRAKEAMEKLSQNNPSSRKDFFSTEADTPDPVFFCTIEPPSLSKQSALETALNEIQREDPSLRITYDQNTEQIVLGGMGELHLEIIRDRVKTEYNIDADLGPLQIAYKETIENECRDTIIHETVIGKSKQYVHLIMSVIPNYEHKDIVVIDKSKECISNTGRIYPKILTAIERGVSTAFLHGPKLACPVINVGAKIHFFDQGYGTSESFVTGTTTKCVLKLLQNAGSVLLEPIMNLEISAPEKYSTVILGDLTKRRAEIKEIDMCGGNKVYRTFAPLSELLGYSTNIRILTSGNATFSLQFSHYQRMSSTVEEEAVRRIGFY